MRLGRIGRLAVAGALVAAAMPALAQPKATAGFTVAGLISEGYTIVSSVMTQLGVALFLQRMGPGDGAVLYMCVVTESPDTDVLSTLYCKAVE
ncbi:MAG: hypothetical protein KIS96_07990 [Bauldia sp.]|nr:hypothetical protein [Bauldia sp.]